MTPPRSVPSIVRIAARLVVLAGALVYLLTGLGKAMDAGDLADAIRAHRVLPPAWSAPAAVSVVVAECAAASGALVSLVSTGRSDRYGAWTLAALSGLLTGYTFTVWTHPPPTPAPCGCGLGGQRPVIDWAPIVARNAATSAAFVISAMILSLPAPRRIVGQPHPGNVGSGGAEPGGLGPDSAG